MGYIRHHAIIVTCGIDEKAPLAHAKATEIFGVVSPLMESPVNGYWTFLVPPDGSKEGWDISDEGDKKRADFIGWLRAQAYEDGSSPFAWVEVQYGDDDKVTVVLTHSDSPRWP